jgi:hypothetical protein
VRALLAVVVMLACGSPPRAVTPIVTSSDFQAVEPAAQPAAGASDVSTSGAPGTPGAGASGAGSGAADNASGAPVGGLNGANKPPGGEQPMVFGLLDGEFALEEAWERWRAGKTTTYEATFEIAVLANRARPLAMSDELMVIALARSVELSGCDPERLGKIRLLAIAVRGAAHPRELTNELERLADMGPIECASAARSSR